jgi:hypothetical protein
MLVVTTGCPSGDRCEMSTYTNGCDGKTAWTYCADKTHTGAKKPWPTVVRIECADRTECVEETDPTAADQRKTISTCVAAPAERCEVLDATRCFDGLRQKCWDIGAGTRDVKIGYWFVTGLSCDGTE